MILPPRLPQFWNHGLAAPHLASHLVSLFLLDSAPASPKGRHSNIVLNNILAMPCPSTQNTQWKEGSSFSMGPEESLSCPSPNEPLCKTDGTLTWQCVRDPLWASDLFAIYVCFVILLSFVLLTYFNIFNIHC